jgi:hypothetical protein
MISDRDSPVLEEKYESQEGIEPDVRGDGSEIDEDSQSQYTQVI